jgi:hypothetical protein
MRMKRLALTLALAASICASYAQTTSVQMSSNDHVAWALIRVANGGKASVGDMAGVHIGEVTQDEFIFARDGKAFVVTDPKVLTDVEAARAPLDRFREVRMKARGETRDIRSKQRSSERQLQSLDRDRGRLNRNADRADENGRREIDRQLKELERKQTALTSARDEASNNLDEANKKLEAVEKQMNALREETQKKVEQIFEAAKAKGLAKPIN